MEKLSIYIHIPFCKKKCKYCDFISFSKNDQMQERYVKSLIQEIKNQRFKNESKQRKISTIYIGGGTPSYINSKYILEILKTIRDNFVLEDNIEITIEVNPGTVNKEKLIDYKKAGINRISIGLQTCNDNLLKQCLYEKDIVEVSRNN